jgi:Flp pilus assembly protein TadB
VAKGDRPWERVRPRDGEVSDSAGAAIGFAFLGTVMMTVIVMGFSLLTLVVGTVLGALVIIGLSWITGRSNRQKPGPPPPQLL